MASRNTLRRIKNHTSRGREARLLKLAMLKMRTRGFDRPMKIAGISSNEKEREFAILTCWLCAKPAMSAMEISSHGLDDTKEVAGLFDIFYASAKSLSSKTQGTGKEPGRSCGRGISCW